MICLFFGGWLPPLEIEILFTGCPVLIWLSLKIFFFFFVFSWVSFTVRATATTSSCALGGKVFLPLSLIWLTLTAGALMVFGWLPNA